MKTKSTYLAITMAFLFLCLTLPPNNCNIPFGTAQLNVNNVKALLKVGGTLWWDGNDAGYIVPKPAAGSGLPEVAAIFAGGLWIGGFDPGGNVKLAASTYGAASGNSDYFAGPLTEVGTTDIAICEPFDRFWSTNKSDIEDHIEDWEDNGVIDGPVPESVSAWPGRMNPEFETIHGFELPDYGYNYASFFDQNGNGIYEPNNGDYPNINGADQAHWSVFNDAGNVHTESPGDVLRMEIHLLAYSYISSNEAINSTTFYDYTFIHKATQNLDSIFFGLWVDPDLGCYTDDYIGCSPEHNMGYVYNMDATDGETGCSCPGGVNTYCEEIPVVAFKILKGPKVGKVFGANGELVTPQFGQLPDTIVELGMTSFMYYNNGGLNPPPPPGTTDPSIAIEYYRLMTGSWIDGTPLTEGGDGYNPGGINTSFAFPDNPSDPGGWSMAQENISQQDQRVVLGSGPARMEPGSVNSMTIAVLYKPNVPHPAPDITCVEDIAEEIQDFYDNDIFTSTSTPSYDPSVLRLSPNPFSGQAKLVLENTTQNIQQVQVFSIDGQLLRTYNGLSTNNLIIEKGNLTPGMYVYKTLTDQQKMYTGKFIVN